MRISAGGLLGRILLLTPREEDCEPGGLPPLNNNVQATQWADTGNTRHGCNMVSVWWVEKKIMTEVNFPRTNIGSTLVSVKQTPTVTLQSTAAELNRSKCQMA